MAGVPDGRDPDGWQLLLASRLASRWQLPLASRLASTRHLLDSFRGSALSRWFARCKNKNSDIFATFFDWGLFFAPVKRKRVVARLITCAFTPIFEIEDNVTVPNRKKVAIWTDFLFFGIPEWGIAEWGGDPGMATWVKLCRDALLPILLEPSASSSLGWCRSMR